MREGLYQELADFEDHYWWHVGRMKIVAEQMALATASLGDPERATVKLLNVGCGTGGTVPTLARFAEVTNVDASPKAIELLRQRGLDAQLVDPAEPLPFDDGSFEIVTALDVLEHTPDDLVALRDWCRVLRPGGVLLLTVPAYQWLWSEHDIVNRHYRRYSRRALAAVPEQVGQLRVQKLSYAIACSTPLVAGRRLLKRLGSRERSGRGDAAVGDETAARATSSRCPSRSTTC